MKAFCSKNNTISLEADNTRVETKKEVFIVII